jgi:hypothetical protein
MDLIKYARKGNIMNIEENYCIYKFKQLKELTEEQKVTKDDNQNSMFGIALRHEYVPIKRHRKQGYKYPTQHTTNQCLNKQRKEKQLNKHR